MLARRGGGNQFLVKGWVTVAAAGAGCSVENTAPAYTWADCEAVSHSSWISVKC